MDEFIQKGIIFLDSSQVVLLCAVLFVALAIEWLCCVLVSMKFAAAIEMILQNDCAVIIG
jgi:hypothetical protein